MRYVLVMLGSLVGLVIVAYLLLYLLVWWSGLHRDDKHERGFSPWL